MYRNNGAADDVAVLAELAQNPTASGSDTDERMRTLATEVIETGMLQAVRVTESAAAIIIVPVGAGNDALAAVLNVGQQALEPFVLALQLVASHLSQWELLKRAEDLDWEANAASTVAELLARFGESKNLDAALQSAHAELVRAIAATGGAIGKLKGLSRCRLFSIHGVGDFDRRSEVVRAWEEALNEAIIRDKITVWPAMDPADRHATLCHQRVGRLHGHSCIISIPLRDADGNAIGAWAFAGTVEQLASEQVLALLELVENQIRGSITLMREARASLTQRLMQSLIIRSRAKSIRAVFWVTLLVSAAMLLPLPHRVSCDCQLTPTVRRMSVAPFDGLLETSHVKTGETVKAGQLLAKLDGRQADWELSGLLANRKQAVKKRDVGYARGEVAEAQQAALEVEQLDIKIQLLRDRQESLRVVSPIDGVVVSGELESVEGAPVTIGQTLFEIAPLKSLKLEIAIPEQEIGFVDVGQAVSIFLEGRPDDAIVAQLSKIAPEAELRDGQNVFVGNLLIDNSDNRLRPGMAGTARLSIGKKMTGWLLFHRVWQQLRVWGIG
ncbi:MAG: biotin carboxyl carrier protein [Pirellulaceae bacterium]|jgi:biotin carboxyl carrier protein